MIPLLLNKNSNKKYKQKQIKNCIIELKEKYPNWKKNKYLKQESNKIKMLCSLVNLNMYTLIEKYVSYNSSYFSKV